MIWLMLLLLLCSVGRSGMSQSKQTCFALASTSKSGNARIFKFWKLVSTNGNSDSTFLASSLSKS